MKMDAYIIKFMGGYWNSIEGYTRHFTMAQLFSFEDLALEQIEELESPWKETCSVVPVKVLTGE